MSFTTLRVSARGVVLFAEHAERLGRAVRPAFEQFASTATEGIYALRANGAELKVEKRDGTRLKEGIDLRFAVSPVLDRPGTFAKPAPPSAYDKVRVANAITLLTDASGEEIYESCVAAVMAWDGSSLVLVPAQRPRVASMAETFVARAFAHRRAPIRVDDRWGLLLINAVASVAPSSFASREEFSPELLAELRAAIEHTAVR